MAKVFETFFDPNNNIDVSIEDRIMGMQKLKKWRKMTKSSIFRMPKAKIGQVFVIAAYEHLEYDEDHGLVVFDARKQIGSNDRYWLLKNVLNGGYRIEYCDANGNVQSSESYTFDASNGNENAFRIPIKNDNLKNSQVRLFTSGITDCIYSFHLTKFEIRQDGALRIDSVINVGDYGGSISIDCSSDIIIEKEGAINADECGSFITHHEYDSDSDKNGILYALGTLFNSETYQSPHRLGLIDVAMSDDHCLRMFGREEMQKDANEENDCHLLLNFKAFKVRPTAWTLRHRESFGKAHLIASNDRENWKRLGEDQDEAKSEESDTRKLAKIDEFYSFFKIWAAPKKEKQTDSSPKLMLSGIEMYGDLMKCAVTLRSDKSIINNGKITSSSSLLSFECAAFENHGTIMSKNSGQIQMKCGKFSNESVIEPKPIMIE